MVNCPRCDAKMDYRQPNAVWLGHFECPECWLAFHYVVDRIYSRPVRIFRRLAQGRSLRNAA